MVKAPEIEDAFLNTLKDHTAGNPQKEDVIWTDLSCSEILERLMELGIVVGRRIVRRLFKKHNYKKRKIIRRLAIGKTSNRNEQFENIAKLKEEYKGNGNPIISCDTKKKEFIGDLFRAGAVYSKAEIASYDHDFPHLAKGIAIPYGILDIETNIAYINIGTSKDTAKFACDSIKKWWLEIGQYQYPNATSILILIDGGGSNSSRHYVFKEALQNLVNEIGIEIRIAHYPPYASKWNPIEHRLFPHITRAMQGSLLKSHLMVKELLEKTTTKKGLKVIASIATEIYETGLGVAEGFKKNMKIAFDTYLGRWNYRVIPMKN